MFVILVTTVPFYGVKEDISTGTGRGQTVKDIVDLEVAHLTIEKKINEDTAVKTALLLYLYPTLGHF